MVIRIAGSLIFDLLWHAQALHEILFRRKGAVILFSPQKRIITTSPPCPLLEPLLNFDCKERYPSEGMWAAAGGGCKRDLEHCMEPYADADLREASLLTGLRYADLI